MDFFRLARPWLGLTPTCARRWEETGRWVRPSRHRSTYCLAARAPYDLTPTVDSLASFTPSTSTTDQLWRFLYASHRPHGWEVDPPWTAPLTLCFAAGASARRGRPRWLETSKIHSSAGVAGHGWLCSQRPKVRRHRSPNDFALSASQRIWAFQQALIRSPPCPAPCVVPRSASARSHGAAADGPRSEG